MSQLMTSQAWTSNLKTHFNDLSQFLFSQLKGTEELNLTVTAEQSTFLRFNNARIRQNTCVDQVSLSMTFQAQQRKVVYDATLTGDKTWDQQTLLNLLLRARDEVTQLPEDSFLVPMENKGQSDKTHTGLLLTPDQAINEIHAAASGADFAGFYTAGSTVRASVNSKGQKHWFSSESFFVDYSLYTKNVDGENKAVKGVYADTHWDTEKFKVALQNSKNQLALLGRKSKVLIPGEYRVYLAPGAVAELTWMLSWGALNFAMMKKGECAFTKLYEKEKTLSPHFSIRENFSMGFSPQFNGDGEMAPEILPLIEKGELKNMLVSSRAAKEYGVPSNGASHGLRAPEVLPGTLPEADALKALGTGLYLSNLHYLNWSDLTTARITGMTRYACFWVENGEIQGPIKDMRFDESLYRLLGPELEAVTKEQHVDPVVMTYGQRDIGGGKVPGMLIKNMSFTL